MGDDKLDYRRDDKMWIIETAFPKIVTIVSLMVQVLVENIK